MMSANNRTILSWRSYSFVCRLHHLIIIIVQSYLKTLNLWNACQIYFVECVDEIRHILSVIHSTIRGAVCFQFTYFLVMIKILYIYILCISLNAHIHLYMYENIKECIFLQNNNVCSLIASSLSSNPAFSRGRQLASFRFENRLPVPEHRD